MATLPLILTITGCHALLPYSATWSDGAVAPEADAQPAAEGSPPPTDAAPPAECAGCVADAARADVAGPDLLADVAGPDLLAGGDAMGDGPFVADGPGGGPADLAGDASGYCAVLANWTPPSAGGTCHTDCFDPAGPARTLSCDVNLGACTCYVGTAGSVCDNPSPGKPMSCDKALSLGCCMD